MFLSIKKDEKHRTYKILGLLKLKIKRKNKKESDWKKRNKHNYTTLFNCTDSMDRIVVTLLGLIRISWLTVEDMKKLISEI